MYVNDGLMVGLEETMVANSLQNRFGAVFLKGSGESLQPPSREGTIAEESCSAEIYLNGQTTKGAGWSKEESSRVESRA